MKQTPTSPYVPDLDQLREWLEKMLAVMKFVELVVAVIGLVGCMRDINLELSKRVAQLIRKRPRSETLERLERELVLPLAGLAATAPAGTAPPPSDEKKSSSSTVSTKPLPVPSTIPSAPPPPAIVERGKLAIRSSSRRLATRYCSGVVDVIALKCLWNEELLIPTRHARSGIPER